MGRAKGFHAYYTRQLKGNFILFALEGTLGKFVAVAKIKSQMKLWHKRLVLLVQWACRHCLLLEELM